jgi:hypothetical protein
LSDIVLTLKKIKNQTDMTLGFLDISDKIVIYKKLSEVYNGILKISSTKGTGFMSYNLKIPYKTVKIILTESETKPLVLQTEFKTKNNFQINIYHEDLVDKFLKLFGKQDMVTGNKSFDDKYLINSNDSELTLNFLREPVSGQILTANLYSIMINSDNGKAELKTVVSRTVGNYSEYVSLIELHQTFADRLSSQ